MKKCTFFVENFCFIKEADVSFIPPLTRRKLSLLDKLALTAMNKSFSPKTEEIVFASKNGEIDRLNDLISQYQEYNEVSPAQFSGSVHNYPAGFFCQHKKLNIPYYALSAGDDSLKNGIIKSIISDRENVLFIYADDYAISCIISKTKGKQYSLENFLKFIEGQNG